MLLSARDHLFKIIDIAYGVRLSATSLIFNRSFRRTGFGSRAERVSRRRRAIKARRGVSQRPRAVRPFRIASTGERPAAFFGSKGQQNGSLPFSLL